MIGSVPARLTKTLIVGGFLPVFFVLDMSMLVFYDGGRVFLNMVRWAWGKPRNTVWYVTTQTSLVLRTFRRIHAIWTT